jgi:hypothetical protein
MCAAPKKGKLFAWLLIKGKIKVRLVLLRQKIVNDDSCPFGCKTRETVEHFALNCGHTTQILALLGIDLSSITELSDIFMLPGIDVWLRKRKLGTWSLQHLCGASGCQEIGRFLMISIFQFTL